MEMNKTLFELEEILLRRGDSYGGPKENFKRIAALWSDWLEVEVNEKDVGVMMILLKIARLKNEPGHYDSYLDIAGYALATIEAGDLGEKHED